MDSTSNTFTRAEKAQHWELTFKQGISHSKLSTKYSLSAPRSISGSTSSRPFRSMPRYVLRHS